ncbi:FecR family protein [Filimonas lacunae]|uniref:FecR family protein n=1 Tax=Filimonas lacunae TaxID=477680 RepID=A0A173MK30_9BACT|nr:FecR domain-containing protein [Filimonas lacunae]BAV07826.1 anti-sigma factor [Filimonas lacunae]SIT05283.1 FecR family protein [Filimonas lacunae]
MNISPELVARFLSNSCSKEEADFLTAYFDAHPEELEKYMGEAEWSQFAPQQTLPAETDRYIWKGIKEDAGFTAIHRRIFRYSAAAAVLCLLAGGAVWLSKQSNNQQLAQTQTAKDGLQINTIVNNTTHNKDFILEDGSEVTLAAHSTLQHPKPFIQNRSVTLEGKAFFNVAKNAVSPFAVTAGGLTTTALGTSFWIESFNGKSKVNIKLVTGKVVIQKDKGNAQAFAPVYLTPGEELVFDKVNNQSTVNNSSSERTATATGTAPAKAKKTVDNLNFNQRPLSEVLKELQAKYNITIQFDEAALAKMKFSGSYSEQDDIDDILHTIALLNELHLEKTTTGYSINP